MNNECTDGLEHDIIECPNCNCNFCTECDESDVLSEETEGGKNNGNN